MIIQSILLANESYTHDNWVYRDLSLGFSRLYYILDGEAYYEEKGKKVRLKRNHLYLTPVKSCFTLTENPRDKLLHTYVHIITVPAVDRFTEVEVTEGTLLFDAVQLWRKYIHADESALIGVLQLVLSCLGQPQEGSNRPAELVRHCIDSAEDYAFDMGAISRRLGYTREHLTRSFYAAYHITPRQYFNRHRMNAALELLASQATLGEIAETLGFASAYSFSKAFKNHFSLSPAHYRQRLAREDEPPRTP